MLVLCSVAQARTSLELMHWGNSIVLLTQLVLLHIFSKTALVETVYQNELVLVSPHFATGQPNRDFPGDWRNEGVSEQAEMGNSKVLFKLEFQSRKVDLILRLKRESGFIAPHFSVEHRLGGIREIARDESFRDCFYDGFVEGQADSYVNMDICGGLRGILACSLGSFLISPVNVSDAAGIKQAHHAQEVDVLKTQNRSSFCSVRDSHRGPVKIPSKYNLRVRENGKVEAVAEPSKARSRRSVSERHYIETMVVADQEMFDFYDGKEVELRRYLLSVMAVVTSIMRDSSIGNYIDVAVVKLVILKKNPVDLSVSGDAAKALKSFCHWQKRHNKHQYDNPEHYDMAVLITRKDLCSSSSKCDTLGLAEVGTVCDSDRSCSIVEDNGLSVAFTIAHEIGHLLGAPHDGDSSQCVQNHPQVHIMTPMFSIKAKTWTWSSCSRRAITDFLESSAASCLLDKPSPKFEHPLPHKLPGELFSMEEQCQLVYGKASTVCPFLKQCDRIWCIKSVNGRQTCHTNNMPWADGTSCGAKKWCIHGKCVVRQHVAPIAGEWGPWGEFQACSRSCGGGVTYSTRNCDSPSPGHGGTYCVGPRRKYKSCSTENCKDDAESFRSLQCAAFNGKDLGIPGVPVSTKWQPKYVSTNRADLCKLHCEIDGYDGIFYELASKVIDGTKCKVGSNDLCVDGQCRTAGCDNILNSEAKVDNCGICNGDNSSCRTYRGFLNSTKEGYNFVVFVPRGASQLKVVQYSMTAGHDTTFLALLNQKREYIFNGQWRVSSGRRRYRAGDADVYYSGIHEQNETIWVPGTLKRAVEIRALSLGRDSLANIHYSYNFPVRGTQSYLWEINENWSECFPVCQGQQIREFECKREFDAQKVSEQKCEGSRPPPEIRKCNQDCRLKWTAFQSECKPIGQCGPGIIEQKISCVMKHPDHGEVPMHYQDCHKAGIGKKPERELPCQTPCFAAQWIYSPWSECNQTCGGGVQVRNATCTDQQANVSLPLTECQLSKQGPLVQLCALNSCPTWHSDAWSGVCSVTCGQGIMQRHTYCSQDGKSVAESMCDNSARPISTQPCELNPCAAWKSRAFSQCSRPCGAGYQIRQIYCESALGEVVADIECDQLNRPLERKSCFLRPCQLNAKLISKDGENSSQNHRWLVSAWSECSASCGGGSRERSVACMVDSVVVTQDLCALSDKPVEREPCKTFPCPFWRHGQWSECTRPCGGGMMTRLVACGYNGTLVDETFCMTTLKPADRRECNEHNCSTSAVPASNPDRNSSQEWLTGSWSECSISCGVGMKSRSVTCANATTGNCTGVAPPSVAECELEPCPAWNYGQWTACFSEANCGVGWQARLVVCQLSDGTIVSNEACNATLRPAANQTCEVQPCRVEARWVKSNWQPCNVACGEGFQFRYVTCEDNDGLNLPEERCSSFSPKPAQQKQCVRSPCASWNASEWGECDSSCLQRRNVQCVLVNDTADENMCDLSNRPEEERPCAHQNCVKESSFVWRVGQWSECGRSCGYSQRAREVACTNEEALEVSPSLCYDAVGTKPATTEQCFQGPCPLTWVAGPWSECSTSCGPGNQTRHVYCDVGLEQESDQASSACLQSSEPVSVQPCDMGVCGYEYRWVMSDWKPCTRSCGIGSTSREVFCVDGSNATQDDDLCSGDRPAFYKVCNVHACPAQSCIDVQRSSAISADGEYQLLSSTGAIITVYCEGMNRNNPKEFLTLKADPKDNYSEIYGKRLRKWNACPDQGRQPSACENCMDYSASGLTFFRKVRLDIRRMALIAEDKTFSNRFGMNPPGYASAGDCYSSARCPQGRFMVNLVGTGLRIAENVTWTSRGYDTSHQIKIMRGRQVVFGKCGGFCGMCSPSYSTGLQVEPVPVR